MTEHVDIRGWCERDEARAEIARLTRDLADTKAALAAMTRYRDGGLVIQRGLEADAATADRLLRASVPERWKGCTSPVGAAQSYIAELEERLQNICKICDEFGGSITWEMGERIRALADEERKG